MKSICFFTSLFILLFFSCKRKDDILEIPETSGVWEMYSERGFFNPQLYVSPVDLYKFDKGHNNTQISIDNGFSWSKADFKTNTITFYGIQKFDKDKMYLFVGDKMLKTENGGNSYTTLKLPFRETLSSSIYFIDEKTGYFYSPNEKLVYRTSNGGENWKQFFLDHYANGKIKFFNDLDGIISSNMMPYFLMTNNSGNSWEYLGTPKSMVDSLSGFSILNKNEIFAWSDSLKFYKSIDGGKSYILVSKNFPTGNGYSTSYLFTPQVQFIDSFKGLCAVNSVIYHTSDGGKTWQNKYEDKINNGFRIYNFNDIVLGKDYVFVSARPLDGNTLFFRIDLKKF